ncbi:putative serine esterase [Scheffersomyces stipitis CBS 6054]|uniref:Putative serine esterase n=1 Tax=Scheffersomyces stipitis (strain ATCC 58785 / CBS 6054 / NBRC 10063 / NRRL Y-11545) TaxID=322104 RepID=A3GGN1_PICST|nr:putative serine esterase [Scheffersomyces stipitis CBS 6054]EAZ63957.2 putative serine esterase [Scheffersomyces stipitis CBS 6054]
MSSSSSTLRVTPPKEEQSAHLFVLVHGLWGSPNHMLTIERLVKDMLPSVSAEKVVTLKPSSFRFWKTYDGLERNARSVISEIFYEIETLKQKNNYNVTKISFVGYSLGGLISRYLIGLLEEMDFFATVKPIFFSTYATPHVGIEFFANNIFDNTANAVGPYLFGPSGRQMFVADTDKALREMADPNKKFYLGLAKFEKHILLANVKNDRTVAFFTSYITEYSPFDDWKVVKIKYLKNLPHLSVGDVHVRPKFVDLTRTHQLSPQDIKTFEGNKQEAMTFLQKNKVAKILAVAALAAFFLPFWIPLVLITSLYVSVYSSIKVRFLSLPEVEKHWNTLKDTVYGNSPVDPIDVQIGTEQRKRRAQLIHQESFKGDTSSITGNAMENIMYAEERFVGKNGDIKEDEEGDSENSNNTITENSANGSPVKDEDELVSDKNKKRLVSVSLELNDEAARLHLATLKVKDVEKFPLFNSKTKLEMGPDKKFIIDSLNRLDWIKVPVYLDCWNAHDGIVSRKGPTSNAKGVSNIVIWCSLLREHLKSTMVRSSSKPTDDI